MCSSKAKHFSIDNTNNVTDFLIDSIYIDPVETDSVYLAKALHCINCNERDYLLTYNRDESLSLYNLSTESKIWNKKISSLGIQSENGLVEEIYFYSLDSIFLKQEFAINIIDTALTKRIIPINGDQQKEELKRNYFNLGFSEIHYDSNKQRIYFAAYSLVSPITDKEFYDYNIESYYDLRKDSIFDLPVTYPKNYLDHFYGGLIQATRVFANDNIYYGFAATPQITVYDTKQDIVQDYKEIKSKADFDKVEPMSIKDAYEFELKMRHMTKSNEYGRILYDANRKIFYRFFRLGTPLENEDGTFNSYGDKVLFLMAFDHKFKKINELNLGKDKYTTRAFIVKDGIAVSKGARKNESFVKTSLSFDIFDLSQK